MNAWSDFDKLRFIVTFALVAMAGFFCYSEWQALPRRALVPGQVQVIDHTVGVVLRNKTNASRYLIFTPWLKDSALAGATLRFRGATAIEDVHISADTGHVKWRAGRFNSQSVPGLYVHVRARLRIPEGATVRRDTLMLRLPAVTAIGASRGEAPLISFNGLTPARGDSVMMQRYAFYPSLDAVERARVPYFALMCVFWLGCVGIAARAIIRTTSNGAPLRQLLGRVPAHHDDAAPGAGKHDTLRKKHKQ
jgi:hypothetical protein